MASFGNHKSSVSALQAKLGACFARELDETVLLLSSTSTAGTVHDDKTKQWNIALLCGGEL
jgi:hypothetical protein